MHARGSSSSDGQRCTCVVECSVTAQLAFNSGRLPCRGHVAVVVSSSSATHQTSHMVKDTHQRLLQLHARAFQQGRTASTCTPPPHAHITLRTPGHQRHQQPPAPRSAAAAHLLQMCAHSLLSCSSSSAACAPPYSSKHESKVAAQSDGARAMACLPLLPPSSREHCGSSNDAAPRPALWVHMQ